MNLRENFLCAKKTRIMTHSWAYLNASVHVVCMQWNAQMRRGTLVNARQILIRKRRNCWIKSLFLFSSHTKGIKLRLNHRCHMDYFNYFTHIFVQVHLCIGIILSTVIPLKQLCSFCICFCLVFGKHCYCSISVLLKKNILPCVCQQHV